MSYSVPRDDVMVVLELRQSIALFLEYNEPTLSHNDATETTQTSQKAGTNTSLIFTQKQICTHCLENIFLQKKKSRYSTLSHNRFRSRSLFSQHLEMHNIKYFLIIIYILHPLIIMFTKLCTVFVLNSYITPS